ncbi:hypothetical protein AB4Z22_45830 [Paenibacillus sp. TAF58]
MHEFLRNVGMILEEFNSDDSFELPSTATYIIYQNRVITAGYADVDLKQANGSYAVQSLKSRTMTQAAVITSLARRAFGVKE